MGATRLPWVATRVRGDDGILVVEHEWSTPLGHSLQHTTCALSSLDERLGWPGPINRLVVSCPGTTLHIRFASLFHLFHLFNKHFSISLFSLVPEGGCLTGQLVSQE